MSDNMSPSQSSSCLHGGAGTIYFSSLLTQTVFTQNLHNQVLASTPITFLPLAAKAFYGTNVVIYGASFSIASTSSSSSCNPSKSSSGCSTVSLMNSTLHCENTTFVFDIGRELTYTIRSCGFNADIVSITNSSKLEIDASRGFVGSGMKFELSKNSEIRFSTYVYLNFTQNIYSYGRISESGNSMLNALSASSSNPVISMTSSAGNLTVHSIIANKVILKGKKVTILSFSDLKTFTSNPSYCLEQGMNASISACQTTDTSSYPNIKSIKATSSMIIQEGASISSSVILLCSPSISFINNVSLNANYMGCLPNNGTGAGKSGDWSSYDSPSSGGGGAGYGGYGGVGYSAPNSAGNVYSETGYLNTGSGGGCSTANTTDCDSGGLGGGIISINAKNKFSLYGNVSANGQNGIDCSGGGSGGAVSIITNSLSGNGRITANGGAGGSCSAPGKLLFLFFRSCVTLCLFSAVSLLCCFYLFRWWGWWWIRASLWYEC
jgi:hypothetical protein